MPDSESPQPTGPASIARDMPDRVSPAEISRLRWKWGMGIVTAGGVSEALVWNQIAPDATYQVLWSIPVLSATACALLVWWIFFSDIDLAMRSLGLSGLISAIGIFMLTFRFEGFEGDMWPQFRYRFAPSAEEQLQTFLTTEATTSQESLHTIR